MPITGHWVKVKVTEANEKVENFHSRNVKLPWTVTPNKAVMFACSMRFSDTWDQMM